MFNLFKKNENKTEQPQSTMRDTQFGSVPLELWPRNNVTGEPWSMFIEAREKIKTRQDQQAIQIYHKVLEIPGLESRHYLQAWYFLRKLKVAPSAEMAKKVYGVIADVRYETGPALIAGYADHRARYLTETGGGVIWEAPDTSLNTQIDELLKICEAIVPQVKPSDTPPAPPSQVGKMQICILTPAGFRLMADWFNHESGKHAINLSVALMKSLIDKNKRK